jgi:activator of HSP90 ATPase
MTTSNLTRRDFSARFASLLSVWGLAGTARAFVDGPHASHLLNKIAPRSAGDDISHVAEAIHQEVSFKASRKRVYEALTDAKQFDQVTLLGEARRSRGKKATEISREPGGTFSLFGGYIVGRNIELVPNERLVQAWREISWKPGVYSLVKFELVADDAGTKIVFDQRGFPNGEADHLLPGWKANYWDPLKQYLEK